ncbi:MAG TPA: helix-turn-helix transcriptional regulator [Geodermatophilus sp.]|nr:helix-turn-helix transcriptional regulator [Geodermatophilus sp.]
MRTDLCATGPLLAVASAATGADRVQEIADDVRRSRGAVSVQGPGGTGKTVLLGELARAHDRAGLPVVGPDTAVDQLPDEFAVLVDDAQRLTDETADRVRRLLRHPGARVTVAFRPWPRPPALAALIDEMGSDRRSVVLGHADRALIRGWAREQLGEAATPGLVDALLARTGGLPALVHPLLRSLARQGAAGRGAAGRTAPGPPARLIVPEELAARLRADLAALDDELRALLHAVAAGGPVDDEVLGDALGVGPSRAAELITAARATGFLLADGEVVPLVQGVLLAATPPDVTRRTRRQLLGLLLDRGEDPLELARSLAADHVRDPRAAHLLERHGDAALHADPALAADLLGAAASSGAPVAGLAARRAQAAALTGDLDGALQWADTALGDESTPDRPRAAGVTATVLARRGLLGRAAELYRLAGDERAGSAALALLATGAPEETAAVLEEARRRPGSGVPTVLAVSEELMAQGVLQSLRSGPDAGADMAASLSTLTRAAALLEPVGRTALLLDTPAALAALVALHSGELGVAESVLQRALAAELGGPPSRPRHLLLTAWIAMLRGRMSAAREHMAEAAGGTPAGVLEPRDDLFLQALEVGLARRSSDVPALVQAWGRAREAFVRYPVDLFTLLPLGELMIAAARLKDADRLRPHLTEAQSLLGRLGEPQLWAAPLHWSGAQAAILADDPAGLRPHAAALVAASRTSPYAATLAGAGRTWMRVLTGEVDAGSVVAAAERLAAVGLAWDGSRLAGQAAVRALDPRARTALMSCARALADTHGVDTAPAPAASSTEGIPAPRTASSPGQLSEREQEVARLIVAGQTYREIGGRLYISAKTVEHHVSRMRQRLGAGNRSDLLARLRAELAEGG